MKIKEINIFTENIYPDWEVDELKVISVGRRIVKYFLKHLLEKSCLNGYDFDSLTFDILFCDSKKTHQINKEYRNKDYAADIITFAIFADDDAKFILDEDINLGEIILALDKVKEEAQKQLGKEEKTHISKAISENAKETKFNYITNSFNSKNSSITESLNTYTQKDFVYDTNFFTQDLETFSSLAFLSNGYKILKPAKLRMFPYFKK